MFSLGRRRDDQALMSASSSSPKKKKSSSTLRQRLSSFNSSSAKKRRSNNVIVGNSPPFQSPPRRTPVISEHDGIEVSLGMVNVSESREPLFSERRTIEPVLDIQELIRWREKIYQKCFSTNFPALQQMPSFSGMRQHRIPLSGNHESKTSNLDALQLLQLSTPKDEYSAVSQELKQLSMELNALELDKAALEQKQSTRSAKGRDSSVDDWDVNRMLKQTPSIDLISKEQRLELQKRRGNNLTFHLSSNKSKQVFLSKCGARIVKPNAKRVITIGSHNCKTPITSSLQNLALLCHNQHFKQKKGVLQTSFFLSSDTGASQTWGHLPLNLFRRIKDHESFKMKDITYLSSGPLGSYFAEFSSGESWWGSPMNDPDLFQILQDWNVHRLVFGPAEALNDARGNIILTGSWIVVAKDGKVAYKNLPSRLHNIFKNRQGSMAGLAEVSLGPGNSYFCKFLDDTVDYCLPAHIASAYSRIQQLGGRVTNVVLHPEISKDFVIRHTEIEGRK